jgi:GR25 family glycosyltransferase involved in LPS biosynthesis
MDFIDCVYYINLDHREDRRKEIEGELDKLGVPQEKRVRIPGIHKPGFGMLGCALAHIKAMETFLESSHTNCLILEDDFEVIVDTDMIEMMLNAIFEEKISFDCLMFAGNIFEQMPTEYPFLHRVLNAQTTSAYCVTRIFAPKLLENLKEGALLLEDYYSKTEKRKHDFCLDIYWKKLQVFSKWYILNPKVGIQRKSYSDIEEKVTHYGV